VRCLVGFLGLFWIAPQVFFGQAAPAANPPVNPPARPRPAERVGGFVPGQQRPPEDPAAVERGNKIYGLSCRSCHGADLRGGDMGGPNLLRSQLALSDKEGELIVPVIKGSLQAGGMPAIPMSTEDAKAVASYVRSVLGTIGSQGRPPATGQSPETILVGNAGKGEAFFQAKCSGCHSATGDLRGIGSRYADPKVLQNTWVAGGRTGRGANVSTSDSKRAVTATVAVAGNAPVEGKVIRIDDFFVTLVMSDGSQRTFRRDNDTAKVEVRDPVKAHRDLLSVYSDADMHDVTAWLVTLK
jgi:cytochrome c oxidase cbb3-type subunit III